MKLGSLFDGEGGLFNNYSVTDCGVVTNDLTGKVLKHKETRSGYHRVTLCDNGIHRTVSVHRLVALAFVPNPLNKPTVNHLNEDKSDNRSCNLEWATNYEQNTHGTRIARARENTDYKARRIDYSEVARKHDYDKMARMFSVKVVQIGFNGDIVNEYPSIASAARETGFSAGGICSCCKNRRKSCKGYRWEYAKTNDAM